jgi:predicted DNA-binding mobile mystery protein A
MSSEDLAARMGVTGSTVVRIEANERVDSVQLRTLRRAAEALGCDLVYALVPREPLEQSVQAQARMQATKFLTPVQHTMLLEAQQTSRTAMEALLADHIAEWIDRPGLWHG